MELGEITLNANFKEPTEEERLIIRNQRSSCSAEMLRAGERKPYEFRLSSDTYEMVKSGDWIL